MSESAPQGTLETPSRDDLADTVEELQKEVQRLNGVVDALMKQNRQIKTVLAGSDGEFASWEPDRMTPIHDRINYIEDDVAEHAEKFEMFVVENGKASSPDERAIHLRQVLYNKGKQKYRENGEDFDSVLRMPRDECLTALGGGLRRATVLDAMKRAADGADAGNPRRIEYTPIDGASDLVPIQALTFVTGAAVNGSGDAEQSCLEIALGDLTRTDVRKNLTTVSDDMEAEP